MWVTGTPEDENNKTINNSGFSDPCSAALPWSLRRRRGRISETGTPLEHLIIRTCCSALHHDLTLNLRLHPVSNTSRVNPCTAESSSVTTGYLRENQPYIRINIRILIASSNLLTFQRRFFKLTTDLQTWAHGYGIHRLDRFSRNCPRSPPIHQL